MKGLDASIRYCMGHYWAKTPQADLTDISFQTRCLLRVQKWATSTPCGNQKNLISETHFSRELWNSRNRMYILWKSTTSPFRVSKRRSKSTPVLNINTLNAYTKVSSASSPSSSMPSVNTSICGLCHDPLSLTPNCPKLAQESSVRLATIRYRMI